MPRGAYLYIQNKKTTAMKSERQKKIQKHANSLKNEKRRRKIALFFSGLVATIPLYLKFGN